MVLATLPFGPIKLLFLVAWIYLCLYSVERVQASLLVPKHYKSLASVAALALGPVLLAGLFVADARRNPQSGGLLASLADHLGQAVARLWSSRRRQRAADAPIRLLDSSGTELREIWGHGDRSKEDSRTLGLTEEVIADALAQRASDILIDPRDPSTYSLRLRVDGVLRMVRQIDTETCRAIINSIKAVSSMDISERRRPQDGAFMAKAGESMASFRVASARALYGEKLSIRILNQDAGSFSLRDVGLSARQYTSIEAALRKPSGMVLVCGPTGSGKTTTLYAMLNQIDRYTHNVITVEDPIEAVLQEASQIEINPKADVTFAKALRSILRQDPDVICVGEIRDEETAEIALRASQTGHLVLATIHCGSNAAALVRLMDLGISPLLLSAGLSLLVSQRLVRRLCEHCKRPAEPDEVQLSYLRGLGVSSIRCWQAAGCEHCSQTGYFGRTAVCTLMPVTDRLKADLASSSALVEQLKTEGDRADNSSLSKQALEKVAAGVTSLDEVIRVLG